MSEEARESFVALLAVDGDRLGLIKLRHVASEGALTGLQGLGGAGHLNTLCALTRRIGALKASSNALLQALMELMNRGHLHGAYLH